MPRPTRCFAPTARRASPAVANALGRAVAWHGLVAVAAFDLARQFVAAIFRIADQIDTEDAGGFPIGAAGIQRVVESALRLTRGHGDKRVDGDPLALAGVEAG